MPRVSLSLLLVLIVSFSTVSACTAAAPRTRPVILWRPVNTWSGQTSLQTESFLSSTGSFRVHWTSENLGAGEPGRLRIALHSAISGRPLVSVLDHRGPGDETTFVAEDPREFFLVIDAERSRWTLTLDEGLPGTTQEPAAR